MNDFEPVETHPDPEVVRHGSLDGYWLAEIEEREQQIADLCERWYEACVASEQPADMLYLASCFDAATDQDYSPNRSEVWFAIADAAKMGHYPSSAVLMKALRITALNGGLPR